MKRYELNEEELECLATCSESTALLYLEGLKAENKIPEGAVYLTRERFEEVTRKYWNGSLPLAVVYILDEIFGNPSVTEYP